MEPINNNNSRPSSSPEELIVSRRYFSKQELAAAAGISPTTVQRYKDAGLIPFFQPGGKGARLLFPPDAVESAKFQTRQDLQGASNVIKKIDQVNDNSATSSRPKLPGPRPRWQSNPIKSR